MKPRESRLLTHFPTDDPGEWYRDHREFVIEVLLPLIHPRPEVAKVIKWAYERGMEARSDGSTLVPDWAYEYGNIKDPMGVGHDFLFELHRVGLPDPEGHVWTLWEANLWYYRAWADFKHPWIGRIWWLGLCLGSWVFWRK